MLSHHSKQTKLNITISFVIVSKDEITGPCGQTEPPGMHMIYLPYADDIRPIEEVQVLYFSFLMKDFGIETLCSVCSFTLQITRHHEHLKTK